MNFMKKILLITSVACVIYIIAKKILPDIDDAIGNLEKDDPEFKDIMDAGRKAQAEKQSSNNGDVKEITVDEIDQLFDDDDDIIDNDPDLFIDDKDPNAEEKDDEIEEASLDDEDVIIPKEVDHVKIMKNTALNFINKAKKSIKNQFSKHDEVAEYFSEER